MRGAYGALEGIIFVVRMAVTRLGRGCLQSPLEKFKFKDNVFEIGERPRGGFLKALSKK